MEQKRKEILQELLKTLERLARERPRDFYFEISRHIDDYYADSLGGLSLAWERTFDEKSSKNQQFEQDLPVTGELLADLERLDDGRERKTSEYAALLARVPAAIAEAQNLLSKYD